MKRSVSIMRTDTAKKPAASRLPVFIEGSNDKIISFYLFSMFSSTMSSM